MHTSLAILLFGPYYKSVQNFEALLCKYAIFCYNFIYTQTSVILEAYNIYKMHLVLKYNDIARMEFAYMKTIL